MVPSGPTTPMGGAQSVTPSLMRSNSGMLGGQGGPVPSQGSYPSLVSPRTQFNNVNLLGNVPNVSSLLNQSFGSGGANPGLSGGLGNNQRVGMDVGAESDPLSGAGTGMGFNPSSSSLVPGNMVSPASSGQIQGQQFSNPSGNQMLPDQQSSQQLETQNFQHAQPQLQQFSAPLSNQPQQQQQQQQQYQSIRGGLGGVSSVKLEPPVTNDQNGSHQQQPQQLQALRSLGPVKLEPQQLQSMRNMGPVKMEPQHSDQSMFLHQQQQLIQQMSMSRQPSQAQLNLLQQQRLLQLQQHQQQHLLKAMPQQRAHVHQSFQPQNLPLRSPLKPVYEPGMCARRLTLYMCQQQQRPEDNNIDFWRKFVTEYFAPNAKKKWCVSMYGSGRQTTGVFPQDAWHCEICNRKPGRGFEATVEVLPRLFKIKYESGTLEELLYVDMPREYQNSSGQIVLDYAKAIQESVFEQLRVVRDGQLRIVFSPDLKIVSWEFCARRHEELIPRRLLIPQVTQLGTAAQKYQAATQNTSSNLSVSDLQSNCNMFVASARQLAKSLEVPLVNDLGYTKRYVRCLQISEVVKSMIDLIDYSRLTGTGPKESLEKFPRRTSSSAGFQGQNQQPEQQQQPMGQNPNNEQSPGQAAAMQLASSNGIGVNNSSLNTSSASASTTAIAGLLHQNSINSRLQNPMTNSTSPYGVGSIAAQMPSPGGSSTTMQQTQPTPSPFQSPTPSSSHVPMAAPTTNHTNPSQDNDTSDSQSSVQKIIQEMMMSSQLNGGGGNPGMMGVGSLGNDVKNINGVSFPAGNGPPVGNPGLTTGGGGFGAMAGGGMGQSASMLNGIRAAAMGNNNPSGLMNGRVGISQQQDLGNQMMSGLGGAVNGFNNLQYEWKPSP